MLGGILSEMRIQETNMGLDITLIDTTETQQYCDPGLYNKYGQCLNNCTKECTAQKEKEKHL